jgi:hypothetical protein
MKWLITLCLLALTSSALAADGDICGSSPALQSCRIVPPAAAITAGVKEPGVVVQKLCDVHTTNANCGPSFTAVPDARAVIIKVVTANNGGAACTYDDWGIFEMATNTTPAASTTFGAICALDDDTATNVVGATASSSCRFTGPVGPYIFIGGTGQTLGTCTDFSVWAFYYPNNAPLGH